MSDEFYTGYPTEPIGGGNPYYRCVYCKVSDPEINGSLDGHRGDCEWAQEKKDELRRKVASLLRTEGLSYKQLKRLYKK